ncbi:hypothetical protein ACIRPQ_29150 [Streptomyces sp. NPDC101213]|uniref:hypothetical protein n=1 Tax=Streptomyces sp. NPDC101213 TaxID=3366130 RepID=UPI00382A92CA
MDTERLPPLDPVELQGQVMAHEEDIRALAKQLGHAGLFEARCALRDAADLLLAVGRTLATEVPSRAATRHHAVAAVALYAAS